MQFEDKILIE